MNSKMLIASAVALLALVAYLPSQVAAITDDQTVPVPEPVDAALGGAMHFMGIRPPLESVTGTVTTVTGASSADATDMTYHGGPIQHVPKVYVCYWSFTNDPYGEKAYFESFLNGYGGSSWSNVFTQYSGPAGTFVTNPTGQFGGSWNDATSAPTHPTQSQIASAALRCKSHFGGNADSNYIVATASGKSMTGFGTQWCAWHSYTTGNVAYTYLPYIHDAGASCGQNFVNGGSAGTLDGVSIVGGHEVAETITDPLINAWYYGSQTENGDLCAWISPGTAGGSHNLALSTGTFAVQTTWSNAVHGCAG